MNRWFVVAIVSAAVLAGACKKSRVDAGSDSVQTRQQEQLLMEATRGVGMPAIKNFRERRMLKEILELRDQDGISTHTYLFASQLGCLLWLGNSVGYGIPYATQFTSPSKLVDAYPSSGHYVAMVIPQADPNGLFSPAAAEGTWVLLQDQATGKARPVMVEPRTITSPFRIRHAECPNVTKP